MWRASIRITPATYRSPRPALSSTGGKASAASSTNLTGAEPLRRLARAGGTTRPCRAHRPRSKELILRTRLTPVTAILFIALATAACGSSSDRGSNSAAGQRTINIQMHDIAFAPSRITVPAGTEVRLVFHNTGTVSHDAFIGDKEAQDDHEKGMRGGGGMHHGSNDAEAITVKPGKTGSLTYKFKAGSDVLIGCHQPGHYAQGMKITVEAA